MAVQQGLLLLTFSISTSAAELGNPCPPSWIQATFVDMGCLFFGTDLYSWDLAGSFCQKEKNATLVEIINAVQFDYLQMHVEMLADHEGAMAWWIGGTDQGREGKWIWISSLTPVENFVWYPNFANAETANCMYLDSINVGANDAPCTRTYKPICQKIFQ